MLMDEPESYATRKLGCDMTSMYRSNPIAAKFYMKKMGYKIESKFYVTDSAWKIFLGHSPVGKFSKSLQD
jgi:hypothetical protein